MAEQLGGEQPIVLEELTVRLLTSVLMLLRQHAVNKRGQCKFCDWTRWSWRFWGRRRQCQVFQAMDFVMRQGLDVVWWELVGSLGREVGLEEVRVWVGERPEASAAYREHQG
ncbi:MAG: hypothetical protein LC799_01285 [Actinobacteria bacterium]|nr:hypothetical protein [Actinomycetota bacterium]